MRVIGIDPGSHITGYGVVEKAGSQLRHVDNGCLTGGKSSPLPERLRQIYDSLMETLETFQPQVIVVEEVFFAKNPSSALKLGESRGIVLLAATQKKIPICEYATREVKQAITGYGQATKEQVQKMVQRLLQLPEIAQVDASDALALAICHLHSFRLKEVAA